eukprot:TRINITY_DN17979_c0_g1_i1.p1 TRINITY_DN17979_c0_g1~~TRINITY_DN17979_c0_g1_i1.p1  ORF type:complete len:582 (+),score=45.34 TRINITY_DN17979_c0_g1_i1:2-1747(+)
MDVLLSLRLQTPTKHEPNQTQPISGDGEGNTVASQLDPDNLLDHETGAEIRKLESTYPPSSWVPQNLPEVQLQGPIRPLVSNSITPINAEPTINLESPVSLRGRNFLYHIRYVHPFYGLFICNAHPRTHLYYYTPTNKKAKFVCWNCYSSATWLCGLCGCASQNNLSRHYKSCEALQLSEELQQLYAQHHNACRDYPLPEPLKPLSQAVTLLFPVWTDNRCQTQRRKISITTTTTTTTTTSTTRSGIQRTRPVQPVTLERLKELIRQLHPPTKPLPKLKAMKRQNPTELSVPTKKMKQDEAGLNTSSDHLPPEPFRPNVQNTNISSPVWSKEEGGDGWENEEPHPNQGSNFVVSPTVFPRTADEVSRRDFEQLRTVTKERNFEQYRQVDRDPNLVIQPGVGVNMFQHYVEKALEKQTNTFQNFLEKVVEKQSNMFKHFVEKQTHLETHLDTIVKKQTHLETRLEAVLKHQESLTFLEIRLEESTKEAEMKKEQWKNLLHDFAADYHQVNKTISHVQQKYLQPITGPKKQLEESLIRNANRLTETLQLIHQWEDKWLKSVDGSDKSSPAKEARPNCSSSQLL